MRRDGSGRSWFEFDLALIRRVLLCSKTHPPDIEKQKAKMVRSKKSRKRQAERREYFIRHGELPPSKRQQSKIDQELDRKTLVDANQRLR